MILEAFMPLNTSKLVLSVVHTIPHPSKPVQSSTVTIIFDTQNGQLVQTAAISFENESIDISKLPNGIYILNIQSGSQTINKRFLKR